MLQQVIHHTPVYVWAVLGLLVYRGIAASRCRVVAVRSVFAMPLIMLALSLQSTAASFGLLAPAGVAWLAGLAIGVVLGWRMTGCLNVDRASSTVRLPGSWAPMALMLAIFAGKFACAVALAMHPAWRANLAFALPACAVFGLLSGAFMAIPLRLAVALREAGTAQAAAA
jgi:hypothetical protein